jgi:hypothetical protein
MAPKYLMQVVREPRPGKATELMQAVIAQRAKTDHPLGTTTMTIASSVQAVVTSTPYESLADLQSTVDGTFEDAETMAEWDKVAALASSTRNNLSQIIQLPDNMMSAKYVERYVFYHDPMSRGQLIAAIQEFSARSDDPNVGITSSMIGNTIFVSRPLESLAELESAFDRLRDDPAAITRGSNVLVHSTDWIAGISKVVSRP